MSLISSEYSEERTPLLIGVEGLGTPDGSYTVRDSPHNIVVVRDSPGLNNSCNSNNTEVDAGPNHIPSERPCIQYHGEHSNSSMAKSTRQAKNKLIVACVICLVFLVGEFVGKS